MYLQVGSSTITYLIQKPSLRQHETWKPCHDGITPSKPKGYALDFSLGKALHQCLGTEGWNEKSPFNPTCWKGAVLDPKHDVF